MAMRLFSSRESLAYGCPTQNVQWTANRQDPRQPEIEDTDAGGIERDCPSRQEAEAR